MEREGEEGARKAICFINIVVLALSKPAVY